MNSCWTSVEAKLESCEPVLKRCCCNFEIMCTRFENMLIPKLSNFTFCLRWGMGGGVGWGVWGPVAIFFTLCILF